VTEQSSGSGRQAAKAIIAVGVVLAAGVAGFYYYVNTTSGPTLAPTVPAANTPAEPEADTDAPAVKKKTIPETLPDITLADLDGKPTALASFAGRPLMVNFWATWCAPCRREIPLLNRIRTERKAQNAEIVGIAVDFREDVLKFVQKTPLTYPLLIGEDDGLAAAEAFGMGMAFPFSVFVDSQNRILTIKVGELHEDEANFAFDRIRDIDTGVITREAAQAAVSEAFRQMAADRARHEAQQGPPANE
jgi:thiol-disulfide isomerase/thioredoxin